MTKGDKQKKVEIPTPKFINTYKERVKDFGKELEKDYPPVPKDYLTDRDLEHIAMNIVHQIGDALYDALPKDIAHKYFVDARQKTNDKAIDFVKSLLTKTITQSMEVGGKKVVEKINKLFPYTFSKDMGSYRQAIRGVYTDVCLREMTDEENAIVEKIIKALSIKKI